MIKNSIKKMDMHLHSIYSERPSEWILKTIGTKESYIDPFQIYDFAKERGMDYITITDHNKIDGIVKLKEKKPDDTIIGVELTTYFPEDNAKIHLLLYNFEPSLFEKLNILRENIYELRDFVLSNNIFYSVAHPLYSVNNKIEVSHIEKLILLFNNFEILNGGRNQEINKFTEKFIKSLNEEKIENLSKKHKIKPYGEKPWEKRFTAGSDDHTGLFIGTAYNYASAENIEEFLYSIKNGDSKISGNSLTFEAHAFQILKIASDYYKFRNHDVIENSKDEKSYQNNNDNRNVDNKLNKIQININSKESIKNFQPSLFSLFINKKERNSNALKIIFVAFDKILFQKQKLSLKEKLLINQYLRSVRKKNDNITKILLKFIIKQNNTNSYNPYDISEQLFEVVSEVIDIYIKTFLKTINEKINNNDIASILGKLSSSFIPLIMSVPYLSSIKHLWKDRNLINEIDKKYFNNFGFEDKDPFYKRIVWLTDTLIDLNGVSVTLRSIGKFAYKNNRDLFFITSLTKEDYEREKFEFNVINFEPISSFVSDIYQSFTVKIPSILNIIKKIYQLNPDEIIISTPGPVGLAGLIASKILGISTKMIFHTDFAKEAYEILKDEGFSLIVDYLLKFVYNLADQILVNNLEYLNILKEKGFEQSKLKIFKRGLDLSIFKKIDKRQTEIYSRYKIKEDNFVMLYTGRISKDKNLDFIIDIYKDLKKRYSFIKFFVVGDGVYLDELKIKYADIKDLIFTGILYNDKLAEYYSCADIMVFPSITDTFGMSVLEAQACGLPALVSNIGGPKTIVKNDETGFILKIDKKTWEKKIIELIEDKKNNGLILKRLSINSRIYVEDKYNINNVIDSYFIKDDLKPRYNKQVKTLSVENTTPNLNNQIERIVII